MKNKKVFVIFLVLVFIKVLLAVLHFTLPVLNIFGRNPLAFSQALLPLRLTVAFVFLWYALGHLQSGLEFNGIGNRCLAKLGVSKQLDFTLFAKFWGMLELLIAISFVFGFYLDISSLLASLILSGIIFAYWFGANSFIFRDVAIFGGTVSLFLLTIR